MAAVAPEPIVTSDWLTANRDAVVVVHVGTTMTGADPSATYLDGHAPGARYVSLDDDLAAAPAPVLGRHPLPTPEEFATVLGRIGVTLDDTVIAIDERGGAFASRLAWMLRIIGQSAAVLDGRWTGPTESGPVVVDPVERPAIPWPDHAIADSDTVAATVAAGGIVIDSRDPARFRGEVEPIDAVAGHVPGAINLPFDDTDPTRFDALAADEPAIVYCGSGVTACRNALAIEAAGLPLPRVYVGSWSGWSTEPGRPLVTPTPAADSA
ncbi:MAG: sulfurtransferase [Ilumatobacter sp.]|uniref:sulfurtransferase n=1 Tax=Ilumatobacter sp. TaxID=1967498 RepID=UPI00391D3730